MTNITSYQFFQKDIIAFFRDVTPQKYSKKEYADRMERFFTNRNLISSNQPGFKKDIKTLAQYSAMRVVQDEEKTFACFTVNRDAIEQTDPALLSRFEKCAGKIYSNRDHEKYPDGILRILCIPVLE